MLTVEVRDINTPSKAEVEIYCDNEGIEILLRELQRLKKGATHEHLMTPSWAGNELTERRQGGEKNTLINHLLIVCKNAAVGSKTSSSGTDKNVGVESKTSPAQPDKP